MPNGTCSHGTQSLTKLSLNPLSYLSQSHIIIIPMSKFLPFFLLVFLTLGLSAQVELESRSFPIRKSHSVDPRTIEPDFNAQLKSLEAPSPDGNSYRSFLMRQKIESRKQFPLKSNVKKSSQSSTPQPQVGQGFYMDFKAPFNSPLPYSGGIPNDNTMAISDDGILVASINSTVWAYDLVADSTLFYPTHHLSLSKMANGSFGGHYYDPKMIYDKKADRFILVFLKDNVPSSSAIIVCFSSTNNPLDPWNVYELPGNPLDNGRWTDFPAISLTENELFITGNLIIPGVSWQVGFDGSVIWQLDKAAGFNNDSILPNKLYSQVEFNGKYTRNIHPVQNINQDGTRQYFLSNRNFDVTNDTIFVMHIDGTLDETITELAVDMGKTTPNYGVPPNGRQADTDTTDPTKGLQTNDGRVLGAITNGEWIQFVSNTVNPQTGFSAIYHGLVMHPNTENQTIKGTILSDPILDFGYPNIAYTGNEDCDVEAIIGMNFTSPTDFPGVGAFYFSNDTTHSSLIRLKEGENYVDKHSDSYERWGDYFGIQRRHNKPGEIWLAGFYGLPNGSSGTWINQLASPDSNKIIVSTSFNGSPSLCEGTARLTASGGIEPYTYTINGQSTDGSITEICDGDTINYTITDQRGCTSIGQIVSPKLPIDPQAGVYPNPFSGNAVVQFELPTDQQVSAYIYDLQGNMVAQLIDRAGSAGLNELIFQLAPLRAGEYVVRVYADDKILMVEKMIKYQ